MGVGLAPEGGGAAAEYLVLGGQLNMISRPITDSHFTATPQTGFFIVYAVGFFSTYRRHLRYLLPVLLAYRCRPIGRPLESKRRGLRQKADGNIDGGRCIYP
jgi:hypothetical protein